MTAHGISLTRDDEGVVLAITGAFDAETVFEIRSQIEEAGCESPSSMTVNLAATEFMDSSGLGFLVVLARRAQLENRHFETVGAMGQVERLLQRVGWPTNLAP